MHVMESRKMPHTFGSSWVELSRGQWEWEKVEYSPLRSWTVTEPLKGGSLNNPKKLTRILPGYRLLWKFKPFRAIGQSSRIGASGKLVVSMIKTPASLCPPNFGCAKLDPTGLASSSKIWRNSLGPDAWKTGGVCSSWYNHPIWFIRMIDAMSGNISTL